MTTRRPTRPRSHVLEELSRQHIRSILPPEWICRDVPSDYGLDMTVEIVSGEQVTGRELWTQALAIFEAIKDPYAAEVRGWLEELGQA